MRIIIVGAGPAGLVLAHALRRSLGPVLAAVSSSAGTMPELEVLLLERRPESDLSVPKPTGAGLGLWPHSVRVLDQLGEVVEGEEGVEGGEEGMEAHRGGDRGGKSAAKMVNAVKMTMLQEAREQVPRMRRSVRLDGQGNVVLEMALWDVLEENHGHPFMLFERHRLIQLLYSHLSHTRDTASPQNPGASFRSQPHVVVRVLCAKTVTDLSQTDTSVTVACADGSLYTGDIVVGADGVRSAVRSLVFGSPVPRIHKSFGDPSTSMVMPAGYTTTYRCIFGNGPLDHPLLVGKVRAGDMMELTARGCTWQIMIGKSVVGWFLYVPQPPDARWALSSYLPSWLRGKPSPGINTDEGSHTSRWHRYTPTDMELLAAPLLDQVLVAKTGLTFGHLWQSRTAAQLVDMEEGVVSQEAWHKGRVVLVGDAVHTMSANLGLGANASVESVVVLTNELRRAVLMRAGAISEVRAAENVVEARHDVPQATTPLLPDAGPGTTPTAPPDTPDIFLDISTLDAVFTSYRSQRLSRATWCVRMSSWLLRYSGLLNHVLLFAGWLSELVGGSAGRNAMENDRFTTDTMMAWVARDGVVLDGVPELERKVGKIPWSVVADGDGRRV